MKKISGGFWAPLATVLLFVVIVLLASVVITSRGERKFSSDEGRRLSAPASFEASSSANVLGPGNNVYWIADLVERALPFVVNVKTERIEKHPSLFKEFRKSPEQPKSPFDDIFPFEFRFFFPEIEEKEVPISGVGSGFIISADGYVVTNYHVVKGAQKVTVTTYDRKEYKAKLVGYDKLKDIAVLKIEGNNFKPAKLGDSSKLRIGEPAIAIGSPFGLEATVTAGIISMVGRSASEIGAPPDPRSLLGSRIHSFIQTDAAINQGNSGGPLLNARGEVIGVNQAIIPYAGKIGFAIPINEVKASIEQIINKGKVVYPGIGVLIQDVTEQNYKELKVEVKEGAYVWQVNSGGPADKAGIVPGDVILQIDGVAVKKSEDLIDEIQRHKVGDRVTLVVAKGGKRDKQVKVGVILSELETEEETKSEE